MERFEAWLKEQGIEVTGQFSTGSGDMVRFQLRLLDGTEMDVALSAMTIAERPQEAIDFVARTIGEQDHNRARGQAN